MQKLKQTLYYNNELCIMIFSGVLKYITLTRKLSSSNTCGFIETLRTYGVHIKHNLTNVT